MKTRILFGLFVAVAVVQLAVPVGQVWKHEDVLRTGKAYKFRTAPVDPYDAFRGRSVALNYADTTARVREGLRLKYRQAAYVSLSNNADGFAEFGELTLEPPAKGDYLRVEYAWTAHTNRHQANFRLPFDKFFMEETKAPQAEDAYRRFGNRRDQTNEAAYVIVRVKGGRGVIEDLFIQDKSIRDFLEQEAAKKQP